MTVLSDAILAYWNPATITTVIAQPNFMGVTVFTASTELFVDETCLLTSDQFQVLFPTPRITLLVQPYCLSGPIINFSVGKLPFTKSTYTQLPFSPLPPIPSKYVRAQTTNHCTHSLTCLLRMGLMGGLATSTVILFGDMDMGPADWGASGAVGAAWAERGSIAGVLGLNIKFFWGRRLSSSLPFSKPPPPDIHGLITIKIQWQKLFCNDRLLARFMQSKSCNFFTTTWHRTFSLYLS